MKKDTSPSLRMRQDLKVQERVQHLIELRDKEQSLEKKQGYDNQLMDLYNMHQGLLSAVFKLALVKR